MTKEPDIQDLGTESARSSAAYLDGWTAAVLESNQGDWINRVLNSLPDLPHPASTAGKAEWNKLAKDLTSLAWTARANKTATTIWIPDENALETWLRELDELEQRVALSILFLQACRFDFQANAIRVALPNIERQMDSGASCLDVDIFQGFDYFARLGCNTNVPTVDELHSTFEDTVCTKTKHLILHGLWLYPESPEKTEYLELAKSLSSEMLKINPQDQIALYRRARAQELLGDYRGALKDMDQVVSLVSPDSPNTFEDYHLRRQIIEAEVTVHERVSKQLEESTRQIVAESVEELQEEVQGIKGEILKSAENASEMVKDQVSDVLFRVVEILGLFIAIVGVLASAGIGVWGTGLEFIERLAIMLTGLGLLLAYFLLLRKIVKPGP